MGRVSLEPLLAICGVYLVFTAFGAYYFKANYFGKAFHEGSDKSNAISLTFDDGPDKETIKVLDVLKKHNAHGTFFCIGSKIEKHPEILKRIAAEGHAIGNHSYGHSNFFPTLSEKKVTAELKRTNAEILKATGKACDLFRPPFGVMNPKIAKAASQLGMKIIGWNIRSYDTVSKNEKSLIDRVLKRLQPGSVVLLHDNLPNCAAVLERILSEASNRKLTCVDIPTLIELSEHK